MHTEIITFGSATNISYEVTVVFIQNIFNFMIRNQDEDLSSNHGEPRFSNFSKSVNMARKFDYTKEYGMIY